MHVGLSLRGRFLLAAGGMIAVVVALTLHVNHVLLLNLVTQNLGTKIDSQIEAVSLGLRHQDVFRTLAAACCLTPRQVAFVRDVYRGPVYRGSGDMASATS